MPKVEYLGIKFDSELEVEYYKYLEKEKEQGKVRCFFYHPQVPIKITKNNYYTPDFVVFYGARIEIVETKGYNPYSKMRDDMIHQVMLAKPEQELRDWLNENYDAVYDNKFQVNLNSFRVVYKKIKYLKAYGFVDWDFKNPNTLANKRKEKINDLSAELKELKEFKKNALRYWNYKFKQACKEKLTKKQEEWLECYGCDMIEELRKAKNNV